MAERPSEKTRVVFICIIVAFVAVGLALALLVNGNDALTVKFSVIELKIGLWRRCMNGVCGAYKSDDGWLF